MNYKNNQLIIKSIRVLKVELTQSNGVQFFAPQNTP